MIRRRTRRLTLGVFTLLAFLLAGTGDLWILPCPHHDAVPTASASGDGADAHTDHGAPSEETHDEGPCTCLGHCLTVNASGVAPVVALTTFRAPEPGEQRVPAADAAEPLRAPTPHRLHQPNAPPVFA